MGIWLGDNGRPHYPPYFPPALNINLANVSSPDAVIATDQPWAVAWYANRMALWLPTKVDDFVSSVEPALAKGGTQVQGILMTPSSHSPVLLEYSASPVGMAGIINNMGDFAPLAIDFANTVWMSQMHFQLLPLAVLPWEKCFVCNVCKW